MYTICMPHLLKMETLILGDSIIKYQPTVLNDDHLLQIKVKCFPGINIARLHKTDSKTSVRA